MATSRGGEEAAEALFTIDLIAPATAHSPPSQYQPLVKTRKPGWQINRVVREEKDVSEAMETIVAVQ